MPTQDSDNITKWNDERAGSVIRNSNYIRHFSELVTRKLRRELQAERVEEPKYTHSLSDMEMTALYFLQAAKDTPIKEERIAYYHEAAVLFEQLSALRLQQDLQQVNTSEISGQRHILAACCYFLAGYEANAIVMASILLKKDKELFGSKVVYLIALLLSKNLKELKRVLADFSINLRNDADLIETLESGEDIFGDLLFEGSIRIFLQTMSSWIHWLRNGSDKLREDTQNNLIITINGLEACGRILDAMILRLFVDILDEWVQRSPWTVLSPLLNGASNANWSLYIKLLAYGKNPITEFWRSQQNCLEPILNLKEGLVISIPTSAGKTRLAEVAIVKILSEQPTKKAVYIVPTRALASEVERTLSLRLGPMHYIVTALYGGYDLSDFEQTLLLDANVLVLTPEKLDLLMRREDSFIQNVGLVVVDEGHQVSEGERGLRLEFILSRIRWHGTKYGIKFLFLSAVLPNGKELANWLTGQSENHFFDLWKPTRTRQYGFRIRGNEGQVFFAETYPEEMQPFVPGLVKKENMNTRDDILLSLAIHFTKVGPTMIFTIKRTRVENLVKLLLKKMEDEHITSLSQYQKEIDEEVISKLSRILGNGHLLVSALSRGIAYHHGAIPYAARKPLETAIRTGWLSLFVANETLSAGVNLPVKNILIDSLERSNYEDLISVRDFMNVVGRAGRAGKEIESNIIFLPLFSKKSGFYYPSYINKYINGEIEPCESQILNEAIELIIPEFSEWKNDWKAKFQSKRGYQNPWIDIIEHTSQKFGINLGLENEFRLKLIEALSERLKPNYSNEHWEKDSVDWKDILILAIRKSISGMSNIGTFIDVDNEKYDELQSVIDSQVIALTVEEILNVDDPESIMAFLPYTLLGTHAITSDAMRKSYGSGLQQRLLKVIQNVPDHTIRMRYNRTGLSLKGNVLLYEQIANIKDMIIKWINNEESWANVIESIYVVVDRIPDLKSNRGQNRTFSIFLEWIRGLSLNEIAFSHCNGDISKASQITENSIGVLLPWGINSLFELMTDQSFNPREVSPYLRNLPGMVAFGLPEPYAVFVFGLGLQDREIAQIVATYYKASLDEAKKEEYSFIEFSKWFSNLHTKIELLEAISKGNLIVQNMVQKASEIKSVGFKGSMKKVSIEISQRYSNMFDQDEEVFLFKNPKENGTWFVLDYLNNRKFDCIIPNSLEKQLTDFDWIATWETTGLGTWIRVTFVEY